MKCFICKKKAQQRPTGLTTLPVCQSHRRMLDSLEQKYDSRKRHLDSIHRQLTA